MKVDTKPQNEHDWLNAENWADWSEENNMYPQCTSSETVRWALVVIIIYGDLKNE